MAGAPRPPLGPQTMRGSRAGTRAAGALVRGLLNAPVTALPRTGSSAGVYGQAVPVRQAAPALARAADRALGVSSTARMAANAPSRLAFTVRHPLAAMQNRIPGDNPNGLMVGEVPWVAGRPWYHGSSSVFEKPDPALSASSSLYGPGHYITDDPAVASTYAPKGTGGAPNVTRYAFEPDRVFDIQAPVTQSDTARLLRALAAEPRAAGEVRSLAQQPGNALNALWYALENRLGAARANDVLRRAGFDAISYPGGKMTGGRPHNALVVLNQALLKRGGVPNPKYAGVPRPVTRRST